MASDCDTSRRLCVLCHFAARFLDREAGPRATLPKLIFSFFAIGEGERAREKYENDWANVSAPGESSARTARRSEKMKKEGRAGREGRREGMLCCAGRRLHRCNGWECDEAVSMKRKDNESDVGRARERRNGRNRRRGGAVESMHRRGMQCRCSLCRALLTHPPRA